MHVHQRMACSGTRNTRNYVPYGVSPALPKDTGMLGNEFFARDLDGPVPTEPPANVTAPGLITLSDGAFWRDPQRDNPALAPRSGDWRESPQNRALRNNAGVQTLFEQVKPLLAASQTFGPGQAAMIGTLEHYARGLEREDGNRWLTVPDNAEAFWSLIHTAQQGGRGEAIALDEASLVDAVGYLDAQLLSDGKRNATPFPGLFVLYLPGMDHDAHSSGHGPAGSVYKEYFRSYADLMVRGFVDELRKLDEYYNKLIVVTADHGHTSMGDVPPEMAKCGDLRKELAPLRRSKAQEAERQGNANLNVWELASLFEAIRTRLPATSPANAYRVGLLGPVELQPLPETDVATSTDIANVIAALNGPMAQFYVKNHETLSFADAPAVIRDGAPAELAMVAEFLRVALTNEEAGAYIGLTRARIETIRETAGHMAGSVDFILYRDPGTAQYRVFDGLDPTSGAVRSRDLTALLDASSRFVFPMERILNMNDPQRSGDIVMHFRFDSDRPITDRFTSGVSCRGWHGGLGKADSYVPLIVAYPGGSKAEFLDWWSQRGGRQRVCDSERNLDCLGNWLATDLIREFIADTTTQGVQQ